MAWRRRDKEAARAKANGPGRRGRLQLALAVILACAAIVLLSYPYASNWLHHEAQLSAMHRQAELVEATASDDLASELEAARRYNERIRGGATRVTDPFDPANVEEAGPGEYWALLNLGGDGMMGAVYVPRVGIEVPVYHGTGADVLEQGAGHVENSSLPVGGESTHAVLAGHNGLPSARIFDALEEVEAGDYFVVRVLGEDLAYSVYDIETVLPDQTGSLVVRPGRDLVTLVTCVPYGVNSHRLLVHGQRCAVPQDWLERQERPAGGSGAGDFEWLFDWIPAVIGAALAIVIAAVVGVVVARRRSKRKTA